VGGNVKLLREDLGVGLPEDYSDTVWGVDVGTLYFTGFKTLRIGLSIRNFGPEMQPSGSYVDYHKGDVIMDPYNPEVPWKREFRKYQMPLLFQFGLAMEAWETDLNKLTLSIVGEHPNDNLQRVDVGGEYWFQNMIALRTGYSFGHDTKGGCFGAGFQLAVGGLGKIRLDYAYTDFGILDAVQMATVSFEF
ncbi:MAG: PorV/PorQ family protein, partial [candidate division KSB1 bacterium]|nr:PorV/PorQ family protein [candidate division KSB1 bacterium]